MALPFYLSTGCGLLALDADSAGAGLLLLPGDEFAAMLFCELWKLLIFLLDARFFILLFLLGEAALLELFGSDAFTSELLIRKLTVSSATSGFSAPSAWASGLLSLSTYDPVCTRSCFFSP